jgi:glycerol-3-phosphate dehydrogenase subunit B
VTRRVLVAGGGMAGTMAAIAASRAGADVTLIARGPGASALSPGVLDVAWPNSAADLARRPGHPFFVLRESLGGIPDALAMATQILSPLFDGSPRDGWYATVLGTRRLAGSVQQSQAQGQLEEGKRFAIAGLELQPGLLDADWVAQSLSAVGVQARPCRVKYLSREEDVWLTPFALAARLDRPEEAERFAEALAQALPSDCDAVLLPPVLGTSTAGSNVALFSKRLGAACAELLPVVPSVPGLRLARALASAQASSGLHVLETEIAHIEESRAELESGASISFEAAVLATGRFVGGGLARKRRTVERLCDLPVTDGLEPLRDAAGPGAVTGAELGAPAPLFQSGVLVDGALHTLDGDGCPRPWLYAAGSLLAGADGAVDGTGLGFAAFTGWLAGKAAASG